MGKILISAFIAFGVLAIVLIPNRNPEELIVEQVLMSSCQQSRTSGGGAQARDSDAKRQACQCGAEAVMKHLAPDLPTLGALLKSGQPLDAKTEWLLKREFNACLIKHHLPLQ